MVTDLRYAMRQLKAARGAMGNLELCSPRDNMARTLRVFDCVQRCQDALERCLEAALADQAVLDETEAELDAEEASMGESFGE